MKSEVLYGFWIFLLLLQRKALAIDDCKQQQLGNYTYGKMEQNSNSRNHLVFSASLQNRDLSWNRSMCLSLEFDTDRGKANYTVKAYQSKLQKYLNIHLMDSWQEYKIEKSYYFGYPNITGKCEDHSNQQEPCEDGSKLENCQSEVDKLNEGTPTDCFKMSSQQDCRSKTVCCRLNVFTNSSKKYQAIYLDFVSTFFLLEISLTDVKEKTLWSENVTLSTSNHNVNFTNGVLTVEKYPMLSRLPESWCYVSFDEPKEIRTGVLLNGVNETSMSKVGWYKWPHTEQDRRDYMNKIQAGLMINTMECEGNDTEWKLHGYGLQDHSNKGILLQDFYNASIVSSEFIQPEMMVKVRTRDKVHLKMTVDLMIPVNYLIDLKESHMDRIFPRWETMTNNSTCVAVTIENGYGKLLVEVGDISSEKILIPNVNFRNFTHFVNVSYKLLGDLIVCVSTVGQPVIVRHCKTIHWKPSLVPKKQEISTVNKRYFPGRVVLICVTIGILFVVLFVSLISVRSVRNRLLGFTFIVRSRKMKSQYDHVALIEENELTVARNS